MDRTREDKNTRYFIDLDLKNRKIVNWGYDQRDGLAQELAEPTHQRVFITKGQYNKLERRLTLLGNRSAPSAR